MASIREYTSARGRTTCEVLFRQREKQASKTFQARKAAERFVARIDLDGIEAALERLDAQDQPRRAAPAPRSTSCRAVAHLCEGDLRSGYLTPRALTGYRRDHTRWVSPSLSALSAESITELDVQQWRQDQGHGSLVGEAIALAAGQVEDDGTEVCVTMERVWRREVGFVEDAKSESGLPRLRVLGDAVGVLRRRLVGIGPADLVFTTDRGLPWDESGFRRDHFNNIAAAGGLVGERRPTPHWLRHSHVVICHTAGMDLAQIQRHLGHKDIQMTINTDGRSSTG